MPTNDRKNGTEPVPIGPSVPATRMFRALSEERRQQAVVYLTQRAGAIYLGDLAEYIAIREGAPSRDRYERILVDLHHRCLPALVDTGVVTYDPATKLVELSVPAAEIRPYLDLLPGGPN